MKQHSKNAVGCDQCAFREDCGGLPEKPSLWGCYSECVVNCDPAACDMTCPNNQHLFVERLAEIEGTFRFSATALAVPATRLPSYVPKIHNGSGRLKPLHVPVAAIPARALIRKSGSSMSCRFTTPGQVRRHFCISSRTAYIISCISVDEEVELFWAGLKHGRLAEELARLKPAAVIVPNFSFFVEDVPRIHTLYNRKRICMAARTLSWAGCPVIVPLNALTRNDWDFWHHFLDENPAMTYVAKEFQTGLSGPDAAIRAINHLAYLQQRLGRPLRPVAFGGSRYVASLRTHFDAWTIVESRAFMMATNRRRAILTESGLYSEEFSPTSPDESTDELLESNIKARIKKIS